MRYTQSKQKSSARVRGAVKFLSLQTVCARTCWGRRKRAASSQSPDEGSAVVEFLGLGITLLIPIMYGVLTVFSLQASVMAAHSASAQVAQYVRELPKEQSLSQAQANELATLVAQDYGVAASDISVALSCSSSCGSNDTIRVDVSVNARLPLVPIGNGVVPVSSYSMSWGS